jgi:hypothetical protein
LVPDLSGVDPDDAFSSIPYEKGSTFLWYLEELVGGPEKFEPFLKAYYEQCSCISQSKLISLRASSSPTYPTTQPLRLLHRLGHLAVCPRNASL